MRNFIRLAGVVAALQLMAAANAVAETKYYKGSKTAPAAQPQKIHGIGVGGYSYFELDSQNLNSDYDVKTPQGPDSNRRGDPNPFLNGNLSAGSMWWGQ